MLSYVRWLAPWWAGGGSNKELFCLYNLLQKYLVIEVVVEFGSAR